MITTLRTQAGRRYPQMGNTATIFVSSFTSIGGASFVPTIEVYLTDAANAVLASLSGLRVAWWDQPVLNNQVAPIQTWTGQTTDVTGKLSVTTITGGSALTAGQVGWIEVTDSDGTTTQSPVGNVAAGTIEVS